MYGRVAVFRRLAAEGTLTRGMLMRIHSSASSETSLRQKLQTCPNSRGASQLQWQHYKPRGQNVWESPEGIRVEPAYGSNVGTYKLELCTIILSDKPLAAHQFFDSFRLPLKLLYVNPCDFKNSEKPVQLVWLLLPALCCPHGVLWDKLLRSTQLAVFEQCQAEFELLWGMFCYELWRRE